MAEIAGGLGFASHCWVALDRLEKDSPFQKNKDKVLVYL
jgi:hypothetical protein